MRRRTTKSGVCFQEVFALANRPALLNGLAEAAGTIRPSTLFYRR